MTVPLGQGGPGKSARSGQLRDMIFRSVVQDPSQQGSSKAAEQIFRCRKGIEHIVLHAKTVEPFHSHLVYFLG